MTYPYLGTKKIGEDDHVVVFFTEENKGVVVMNESNDTHYRFGLYNEFSEDEFDLLPEGVCVRLNN